MPLFSFCVVGSFLLAALLAVNWCVSAPIALEHDVPLDQKINIRIHTDHKCPERVVFDKTNSRLVKSADAETIASRSEPAVAEERRPFDTFAEIAAVPVRACFRPPCSAGQAAARQTAAVVEGAQFQVHSRIATRRGLTFSNRFHKLP